MKGEYIWIVFLFLVGGCSSKSTGDIMDISVNIESEGRMSEYFQEAELFFLEAYRDNRSFGERPRRVCSGTRYLY